MATQNLVFQEIDTGELPSDIGKAFSEYDKANRARNDARKALEALLKPAMRDALGLGEHEDVIFAYRWGKVSYAVKEGRDTSGDSKGKYRLKGAKAA